MLCGQQRCSLWGTDISFVENRHLLCGEQTCRVLPESPQGPPQGDSSRELRGELVRLSSVVRMPDAQSLAVSADKASVVSAAETSVVSADMASIVSADKTSVVSQDIPVQLRTRGPPSAAPRVVGSEGMSWEAADVLPADTIEAMSADTTDVSAADTTGALSADTAGLPKLQVPTPLQVWGPTLGSP